MRQFVTSLYGAHLTWFSPPISAPKVNLWFDLFNSIVAAQAKRQRRLHLRKSIYKRDIIIDKSHSRTGFLVELWNKKIKYERKGKHKRVSPKWSLNRLSRTRFIYFIKKRNLFFFLPHKNKLCASSRSHHHLQIIWKWTCKQLEKFFFQISLFLILCTDKNIYIMKWRNIDLEITKKKYKNIRKKDKKKSLLCKRNISVNYCSKKNPCQNVPMHYTAKEWMDSCAKSGVSWC
jgi:hypothetical protein